MKRPEHTPEVPPAEHGGIDHGRVLDEHGEKARDMLDRAQSVLGMRRLMMAVLLDAIDCYQRFFLATGCKRRFFSEAEQWFMGRRRGALSFQHVCDCLGLDAERLRAGLRRWRDRELGKIDGMPPPAALDRRTPAVRHPSAWHGSPRRPMQPSR
jgi:hypothetical protein